MNKVRELLVVEGKHDKDRLEKLFDCDTVCTNGLGVDEDTLKLIAACAKRQGVIVITDPDGPGEMIRAKINDALPGLRNAFIDDKKARRKDKTGVEYATKEALDEALSHIVTYRDAKEGLTINDLYRLGLAGQDNSRILRDQVASHYHLGHCNSKTLLKRLNMLEIGYKELEELLSV